MTSAPSLPIGTVTFLFSDIEGSTRLLQALGEGFRPVLERHNTLVTGAADAHHGVVVKNEGDGFFLAFQSAVDAVTAAVAIQRAMAGEPWPEHHEVRVRIGVHTGEGRLGGSDYVGLDVHRAARIGDCGHGGQILLSDVTARLTEYMLPPQTSLHDLGSHSLKDLQHDEHLYQLDVEGLPNEFPPVRTMTPAKGNLPHLALEFIGRREESEAVVAALSRYRLVTLTGPGGVGKTSLAINVASEMASGFRDGAWLVEVSRVEDENRLAAAIARQLRITETPTQDLADTLAARLAGTAMLLVLDGCEHLIDAVAKVVDQVLLATTEVRILVTSREWLAIRGEYLIQVGPLSVPSPEDRSVEAVSAHDSVALFLSRAHLVQPDFTLDQVNAPVIAEVCRRLDGIPLAIELAAARLKVLSPWQLVQRLDQQFALLAGRGRDLPPHQQTLETTLDWSYDFLTSTEQSLFARLSVFAGGFTLEASEEVCAGGLVPRNLVLDLLGRLVETSLVMASGSDPVRYRLLEPIVHYARMRLDEAGDAHEFRARHARFYLALAETADEEILGPAQASWVERLDAERYNLRAALRWLHESGEDANALRLAGALRWFWTIRRDVSEGSDWLERTLARRAGAPSEVVARAASGAGLLAIRRIDFDRAEEALTEAVNLYRQLGDDRGTARQVYHLATLAWFRDQLDEADELAAEAEELSRATGDDWSLGWTLAVRGTMARARDDVEAARRFLEESHRIFQRGAGILDVGWSSLRLAALARDEGAYDLATELYADGRRCLEQAGDTLGLAHADAGLGAMAWLAGDGDEALARFRAVLEGFSLSEEAANNLFELKTMIQSNPTTAELQQVVEANRERARRAGDAGARAALAEYLYHIGKTAYRHGELDRSRAALTESLALSIDTGDERWGAVVLAGLAVTGHAAGDDRAAAGWFVLAEELAERNGADPWPPPEERRYRDDVEATRSALGEEVFDDARRRGAASTMSEALQVARAGVR